MSFSTIVKLNDVDDYIAPAKSCIKPVKIDTQAGRTKSIRIEQDGTYTAVTETGESYSLKKASISLNDCLACSGCITTAESVLISEHSAQTFLDILHRNRQNQSSSTRQLIAVSISPQSIVSLASELTKKDVLIAERYEQWKVQFSTAINALPEAAKMERFLAQLLHAMGVHIILDTTWFRDVALSESASEFIGRFKEASSDLNGSHLPVFCGACPGWICYAEKTHGGGGPTTTTQSFSIVPHLSVVRSPQQIAGHLLKQKSKMRQSLYHVTIMPCFDKKLEASRVEFAATSEPAQGDSQMVPDVDLVLATNELLELLNTVCIELGDGVLQSDEDISSGNLDVDSELWRLLNRSHVGLVNGTDQSHPPSLQQSILPRSPMYRHPGSGSGGYAMFVFAQAAHELFSIELPPDDPASDDRVLTRTLLNQDLQELLLFASSRDCASAKQILSSLPNSRTPYRSIKSAQPPSCLLAFAVANGFRNIQNLVQSLKNVYKAKHVDNQSTCRSTQYPFDYVEIMACPGGCLNGGGQLKGTFEQSSMFYQELPPLQPMSTLMAQQIGAFVDRTDPKHHGLHTQYREVPKIEIINPSALQW